MTRDDEPPIRLIDLAVEWPLQYAGESAAIDPSEAHGVRERLGQVDGYLSATRAAIAWFGPGPGERPDPWGEVSRRFAGIEAEFSGRLLADPIDLDRFEAEPDDTLTWAVAGLRNAADLLRTPGAEGKLAALIDRGLRAVRLLGSVDRPGDPANDRGLTDEERSIIASVCSCVDGSGLLLDLAGLPPTAAGEAMSLLEALGPGAVTPIVSLSGPMGGLGAETFGRLRSLGGLFGCCPGRSFAADAEEFIKAIEANGEATAIGTGFLGIDDPIEGLGNVPDLIEWLSGRLGDGEAQWVVSENALALIRRVISTGRAGTRAMAPG